MAILVKKSAETIEEGIANMLAGAEEDYRNWMGVSVPDSGAPDMLDITIRSTAMEEFTTKWVVKKGKKYVKILTDYGDSAWGFVVNTNDDKKFKRGDILKCAGWAAPARNAARGNILEGGYPIQWTGPVYLK